MATAPVVVVTSRRPLDVESPVTTPRSLDSNTSTCAPSAKTSVASRLGAAFFARTPISASESSPSPSDCADSSGKFTGAAPCSRFFASTASAAATSSWKYPREYSCPLTRLLPRQRPVSQSTPVYWLLGRSVVHDRAVCESSSSSSSFDESDASDWSDGSGASGAAALAFRRTGAAALAFRRTWNGASSDGAWSSAATSVRVV
mmetsp:Transcript_12826/g.39580  ORF Transcript_12826/g.39580 Transcript_12826/m.39580 type:complete len:203 (-) Transcript_12826:18-626(-)